MTHCAQHLNRRDLIKSAALLAGGLSIQSDSAASAAVQPQLTQAERPRKSSPCLFSKPLHNRKFTELPALLNELGINAVDLTCRPAGHVLPERVADDLPRAVEMLEAAGISVPMVTTAVIDAGQDHAEAIIRTVGKLGIRHIKLGYYEYKDLRQITQTIAEARRRMKDIAALCRDHHVHAGYHLHCGKRIGGGLWDVWHLLLNTPSEHLGAYFDLRHATVEGGDAGWEIALNLLAPRITMLALKDFVWSKNEKGRWKPDDVPLGTGIVRLDYGLRQLKQLEFAGPISLHVEYASGSTEVGSDQDKKNLSDIRRDWQTMNEALRRAKLV